MFKSSPLFREHAEVFGEQSALHNEVAAAEEKALVLLYSGKPLDTLDYLRQKRFREKVVYSSTHVQPHNLPPSSEAAKFHCVCTCRFKSGLQARPGQVCRLPPCNRVGVAR